MTQNTSILETTIFAFITLIIATFSIFDSSRTSTFSAYHNASLSPLAVMRELYFYIIIYAILSELKKYIKAYRKKYARHRTVEYDMDMIAQHRNKYAGYICFLTNDRTIETALDALTEYSTRDYIEKDFDEMKNELDFFLILRLSIR